MDIYCKGGGKNERIRFSASMHIIALLAFFCVKKTKK